MTGERVQGAGLRGRASPTRHGRLQRYRVGRKDVCSLVATGSGCWRLVKHELVATGASSRPQEFANTAWAFATARRAEERSALWRPRAWAEGVCMCLGGRRRRQGGSHISSFCVWRRMSTASRLLKTLLESSRLAQTSSCRPASALVSPIRRGPCLTGHFSCRCAVQAQGPLTYLRDLFQGSQGPIRTNERLEG